MSKFKVGDKVRVTNSMAVFVYKNNDVGIVQTIYEDTGNLVVLFDGTHGQRAEAGAPETLLLAPFEVSIETTVPEAKEQTAPKKEKQPHLRYYRMVDLASDFKLAKMRVHQLEVEMNKAVDELADERTAYALLDADCQRLYGVIDGLTERLTNALEANWTQLALTESYKGLYERLTVWACIKRALGKAVGK